MTLDLLASVTGAAKTDDRLGSTGSTVFLWKVDLRVNISSGLIVKSSASGRVGNREDRGPKLNRNGEGVATAAEESMDARGGPKVERRDKPRDIARGLSLSTGTHDVPRWRAKTFPGGDGETTASSTASICREQRQKGSYQLLRL